MKSLQLFLAALLIFTASACKKDESDVVTMTLQRADIVKWEHDSTKSYVKIDISPQRKEELLAFTKDNIGKRLKLVAGDIVIIDGAPIGASIGSGSITLMNNNDPKLIEFLEREPAK